MIAGLNYNPIGIDIWSIGVIIYALFTGHLPFDDKDTQLLYDKILIGEFYMPDFLS